MTAKDLLEKKCRHQLHGLNASEIAQYLYAVENWTVEEENIVKTFAFKDYYQTLSFVNAIVYIIHGEDHHPELVVTYNKCTVKFTTHSVNNGKGGLSENDFICAAKIDAIFNKGTW